MKANQAKEFEKNDYGVFLNADASSLERFKMYETIVIDAQYFTKRDIELLHQNGTVVYTYLNIGSIENFREYYTTYAELAIGEYEHWEEEQWVDVANPDWQKFIGQLSQESVWSGIDFDKGTFQEQMSETRDYFCKYLEAFPSEEQAVKFHFPDVIISQATRSEILVSASVHGLQTHFLQSAVEAPLQVKAHYIREDLRSAFLSDGKCLRSMLLFCFSLPLHFVRTEQMHLSNGQILSPKPTCVSRRIAPL